MKRGVGLLLVSLLLSACTSSRVSAPYTLYTNGHWWNGGGFVAGERAVSEGRFIEVPKRGTTVTVVDLEGAHVVPPFGEAHNHNLDIDTGPWAVDIMNRRYLADGVFYMKNLDAYPPHMIARREYLARVDTVDVSTAMGGITASGGHPETLWMNVLRRIRPHYRGLELEDFLGQAFHHVSNEQEANAALDTLERQGADFVKVFQDFSDIPGGVRFRAGSTSKTYSLSREMAEYIVPAAQARGWRVSIHVNSAADFRAAVAMGADEIAHLPGYAFSPDLDVPGAYRISKADAAAAAKAGVVVVTTIVISRNYYGNGKDPVTLKAVRDLQRENLRTLHEAGVTIAIGSDEYEHTVKVEVDALRELAAFDDATLLKLWIDTAKATIFPERNIGCLAPSCEGSFLALDGNPLESFEATERISLAIKQGVDVTVRDGRGREAER